MFPFPEDIYELILEDLNETIDEAGARCLRQWLDADPENRAAWEEFCSLWYSGRVGGRKKNASPDIAWQQILERRHRQRRFRLLRISSVAASLLLLAGLFVLLRPLSTVPEKNITISELIAARQPEKVRLILPSGHSVELEGKMDWKADGATIRTDSLGLIYGYEPLLSEPGSTVWHELVVPHGGEFQITLADGTVVMLNSGSSLRYPLSFTGERREVYLTGEAYFRVSPRREQPFWVHTGHTTTRVLGTTFNVMAYDNEQRTEVTLVSGLVEVDVTGKTERLSPGFQVAVDNSSLATVNRKVNTEQITSWVSGILRFDDIPLEQLVVKLKRWYDVSFEFKQESLKQKVFSGGFRKYEHLEKVLDMIEKVNDVSFKVENNTVTIDYK